MRPWENEGESDRLGTELERGRGKVQLKDQAVRGYSSNRDGIEKRGPSKQGLAVEQGSKARKTRKTWLARWVWQKNGIGNFGSHGSKVGSLLGIR